MSGVARTGSTATPEIRGDNLPSFWGKTTDIFVEGFASSAGSGISLPANATAALTLFSITGSTLFTKAAPTNVDTAADEWIGFWMNDAASLLFVVSVDTGTAPDTFFLSSINTAGTVVNIGNDQPSSDFLSDPSWADNGWIQTDGAGGFKIFSSNTTVANNQFAVINSSGTFTTDPTATYSVNAKTAISNVGYETTGGNLINLISYTVLNNAVDASISNKTESTKVFLPTDSNLSAPIGGGNFMRWRDYVFAFESASNLSRGSFKYTPEQVNAYVDELLNYAGITPL